MGSPVPIFPRWKIRLRYHLNTCKEKAEEYKKAASTYFGILRQRILDADSFCWKWFSKAFWSAGFWTAAATVTIAISTIVYTHYARNQWAEMTKATKATQDAAYAACVNAQISQRQLLEIQRTNSFSQMTAVSSTMQTAAEIDTERAYVNVVPRLPKPDESFPNNPNFEIVYSVKNDGKAAAKNGSVGFRAVLVGNDETLRVTDAGIPALMGGIYLAAGNSIPGTPEIGRPVSLMVPVVDNKGNNVAKTSEKVQEVLTGSAMIAVTGYVKYSDFSGTHNVRFCSPIWEMLPGTQLHGYRANQTACAKYNRQKDEFALTASPPLASPQEPLPNVTCTPRN
jgi:hypothetical protein